jgi:predicted transcriptional regulator YheO
MLEQLSKEEIIFLSTINSWNLHGVIEHFRFDIHEYKKEKYQVAASLYKKGLVTYKTHYTVMQGQGKKRRATDVLLTDKGKRVVSMLCDLRDELRSA